MYETREKYLEIVAREVRFLEKSCDCKITNGHAGFCPRCGHHGIWDIETIGFIHHEGNSIYYSTVFNEWRCGICDNPTHHLRRPATAVRRATSERVAQS